VEAGHESISMARQCELLGLSRSSLYYRAAEEDAQELQLRRLIDEEYTKHPFYGNRRLVAWLRTQGEVVNRKQVRRLMREMGLEAIYPKPRTTIAAPSHKVYPYLLRGLEISRPNQVWSVDITYIRLSKGFVFLVAIIDWFSRYVLSWRVSNTMEVHFCLEALDEALAQGRPEIFNSDQGAQFTSEAFTGRLLASEIRISMDGRGRALDNIFVERLWRSVKYEEVYLKNYVIVSEAINGLRNYFQFYNCERLHQSLAYKTPAQIHFGAGG
jgi:putative transposase